MDGMIGIDMDRPIGRAVYICDPAKNKECRKTACYFLNGGECFLTLREEFADTETEHTIGELARKAWKIPEDMEDETWTD